MSTEIGQNRKTLLLNLLDVILIAFLVSALFWVFQTLVSETYLIHVIVLSAALLCIACWVTFKLIVFSKVIDECIPICLIHKTKTGEFVSIQTPLYHPSYELSIVASRGFSAVRLKEAKYIELFLKEFDLKAEILRDFWVYAFAEWLTMLTVVGLKSYRRNPSRIDITWLKTEQISDEVVNTNLFLKNVRAKFPFTQKTLKFDIENEQMVIKYPPMRISLSYELNSWSRSIDSRIVDMLKIPKENLGDYGTIEGFIRFKAEFGARSIFYRKSDKYFMLANQLLDNLREKYDWKEYMDNLKDYFQWKHIYDK